MVDDFAHHPTEVEKSIEGLRTRYPGQRVVVLFEPRSLSSGRSAFFDRYVEALSGADRVFLAPVFHAARLAPEERLDLASLVTTLERAGVAAAASDSVESLFQAALEEARNGDVLVTMSSGSFEGMPQRLAAALAESSRDAAP